MKAARFSSFKTWPFLRPLAGLLGAGVLFVAVMGFAHTAAGRPLLGALGRVFGDSACPLGYDKLTSPRQREKARVRFAASHRGPAPATKRPALGFELDRTSSSEVMALMVEKGVVCRSATASADLVCDDVPSSALPQHLAVDGRGDPRRTLWFNFGPSNCLVTVVALSRHLQAPPISTAFTSVVGTVSRQAGAAANIVGDATPAGLAAGTLRQASAEFRFSDYYASARATNMGTNFLLTEEYRSLLN